MNSTHLLQINYLTMW